MVRSFLRQGLDKEVYQVVTKLLDEEDGPDTIDVATVYQKIKRSNSSLSRKSKVLLEDSIERILTIIKEEASDSEASNLDETAGALPEPARETSNAMNRSIARAMQRQTTAEPSQADTKREEPGTRASKRQPPSTSPAEQRMAKRPKKRDLPSVEPPSHVSLTDIGGMGHVIEKFQRTVVYPMLFPDVYAQSGMKIPHGVLLHGPPGCGKTMLCEAIAGFLQLPFLKIDAPSVVSGMSGESEKALRQHFEHAVSIAPCLMFIDEIDAITPKRENAAREMERRIVAQLLTCMDNLDLAKTGGKPVIVLAATNRPDSIDLALRRPGRFDEEISIGVPNEGTRESILRVQTKGLQTGPDVDFARLAKMTPGFVGADLVSLVFKAGVEAQTRMEISLKALATEHVAKSAPLTNGGTEEDGDVNMDAARTSDRHHEPQITMLINIKRFIDDNGFPDSLRATTVTNMDDFLRALPEVQPSAKREGFATIPDTTWEDIGALYDVRRELQRSIVEAIRDPEKYKRYGLKDAAGVLLWGPPGCGKTLLAKAVANESKANFISVKGPELLNKFVGESERAVRQVFFRARSSTPCVIFFDELDALVPRRDDAVSDASARVVNTLLTELDGLNDRGDIYVIAATNRPEMIDVAMLRPGRLGKHLFVGLPGPEERSKVLSTIIKRYPVDEEDNALAGFALSCDHFSGADLESLAREAAMKAMDRDARGIGLCDLEAAKAKLKPSIDETEMAKYSSWHGGLQRQ